MCKVVECAKLIKCSVKMQKKKYCVGDKQKKNKTKMEPFIYSPSNWHLKHKIINLV